VRHGKLGVLIAAVVASVTVPATASAHTVAACGTTPEQWVGYFPGFTHYGGNPGDATFDNVITLANGVLDVEEQDAPDNYPAPYGTPALDGSSLTWAYANTYPGGPGFSLVYTTDGVTCANGAVQSFTGNGHFVYSGVLGETLLESNTPFSATRA
jgi:hypothetical protein